MREFDPLRSENFYKLENRKNAVEQELIEIIDGKQLRLWIFKKEDIGYERIHNRGIKERNSCYV